MSHEFSMSERAVHFLIQVRLKGLFCFFISTIIISHSKRTQDMKDKAFCNQKTYGNKYFILNTQYIVNFKVYEPIIDCNEERHNHVIYISTQ